MSTNRSERIQTLLKLDQRLTASLQLNPADQQGWWPAVLMAHSGDSWFWAIGVGLVWLFGNADWHRYAAILEIAIVAQALLVFALKTVIRRQRPNGSWGSVYRQYDPHSFPSGHAVRSIMLMVLAIGLGPAWFGWVISLWAPLVSISRVMTGVHYLSDILAGMAIGLLLGLLTLAIYPLWMQLFPFLF